MSSVDEIAVYRAYIEAKADPNRTVAEVATVFGITRSGLYDIVRRIENGNVAKLKRCTEQSKLDCFWEYKYKARFSAIPKDRKEGSVVVLRKLIGDMHKDGFSISGIAERVGKDRATVLHHLNNV